MLNRVSLAAVDIRVHAHEQGRSSGPLKQKRNIFPPPGSEESVLEHLFVLAHRTPSPGRALLSGQ